MVKKFIIIHGPTGVGKTDTINELAKTMPIEIVNCDVGQFYEPFTIGTAKPDWRNESVPHHLFDYITEPKNITVVEYRELIIKTMHEIWERKKVPVLVGGSGFYGKSLFFPPQQNSTSQSLSENDGIKATWQDLFKLDPERAKVIAHNDQYRIDRALAVMKQSGKKASEQAPLFNPIPGTGTIIFLIRDRDELYDRINARTRSMLKEGWSQEVAAIQGTEWEQFLGQKKLIGYTEILNFLKSNDATPEAFDQLVEIIAQKTRNYAKRQITFWKMFKKLLEKEEKSTLKIVEINISETSVQDILKKELS